MATTQNVFHFPDGYLAGWIDLSYCDAQFNIGEKVVIEGESQEFIIVDIQNQFRRLDRGEAGQSLKMIMRNIILERVECAALTTLRFSSAAQD